MVRTTLPERARLIKSGVETLANPRLAFKSISMSTESFDLTGKVALITGTSRGLGQYLGRALAKSLADNTAVLLRGHGAVVVAPGLHVVAGRSYYLSVNAKVQQQAIALGGGKVTYLDPGEARKALPQDGYERSWELWKQQVAQK